MGPSHILYNTRARIKKPILPTYEQMNNRRAKRDLYVGNGNIISHS